MEDCTLSENILSFFYWGTTRINQLKLEHVGLGNHWTHTHTRHERQTVPVTDS